ncbi:VOC family protein [Streptomyces iconiensis]|uniref:VOC family protein n=1 Tax=Streptomyces iconiensis TaxID=1384038 RepID=A0ABT7A5I1_9ACTN|nr:VOC family protein [Streptomyces iconiensis]MDJ1136592.1 VOC family protein [Streptomyces iconiensis]
MTVNRAFASVLADAGRMEETRDFYAALLGLKAVFDSDWFVNLQDPDLPVNELGIWRRDHELVPGAHAGAEGRHQGTILTFVVDDVNAAHRTAVERGFDVVEAPRDTFYGQRSMLVRDPNGQLVDVSTPAADLA